MCSWLGMLCVLAKMAKAGLKWNAKGQIGQAHAKMDAGGQFPYMSQKGQRVGARDEGGNPLIKDCYSNPLTASGNPHDDMLLSKLESIYTESGDHGNLVLDLVVEMHH